MDLYRSQKIYREEDMRHDVSRYNHTCKPHPCDYFFPHALALLHIVCKGASQDSVHASSGGYALDRLLRRDTYTARIQLSTVNESHRHELIQDMRCKQHRLHLPVAVKRPLTTKKVVSEFYSMAEDY